MLHSLESISGRSPDGAIEIFDFQISNTAYDVVFARLSGEHNGGTNRRSTFTYAVKSGELTVTIDGSRVDAKSGDVVTVEPGSSKVLNGEADLFIICSPPFNPVDEL